MAPDLWNLSSSLLNQSIRNPKRDGITDKDRKSTADSSNNSFAPSAVSQGSRKQCQRERNPELAKNDVPRSKRNHAPTIILPPMNSPRHLLIKRNIDCAKQSDHNQTDLDQPLPQPQSDISELLRHDFPSQWHPQRRSPNHRAPANRVVQRTRVIDQPGVSRELSEAD
jgi:hypothetical protein